MSRKNIKIARLADTREIRENMHNLSIPLYVHNGTNGDGRSLESIIEAWHAGRAELKKQSRKLFAALADIGITLNDQEDRVGT